MFHKLRKALDAKGMTDKQIGWTTRFNAFTDDTNRPAGYLAFASDGEGIAIEAEL